MKLKIRKRTSRRANTRQRRKVRIRKKIFGTAERPRLCVFRSQAHIYAQIIDDEKQVTLATASTLKGSVKGSKKEKAKQVGLQLAEQAKKHKLNKVVFDRNGFIYHGCVKELSEGVREGGIEF